MTRPEPIPYPVRTTAGGKLALDHAAVWQLLQAASGEEVGPVIATQAEARAWCEWVRYSQPGHRGAYRTDKHGHRWLDAVRVANQHGSKTT